MLALLFLGSVSYPPYGNAPSTAQHIHARRILKEVCEESTHITQDFHDLTGEEVTAECSSVMDACLVDKTDDECKRYAEMALPELKSAVSEVMKAQATLPTHTPEYVMKFMASFEQIDVDAFAKVQTCEDLEKAMGSLCTLLPTLGPIVAVCAMFAFFAFCCCCCFGTTLFTCLCCCLCNACKSKRHPVY